MAERRPRPAARWALWLVVVMMAGTGACGDDSGDGGDGGGGGGGGGGGRPSAAGQPRDDEITATIDDIWAAAEVNPDEVATGAHGYDFMPATRSCSGLARDDRWYGYRSSSLTAGGHPGGDLRAAIARHLDGEGFEVDLYRGAHPESRLRGLIAVQGELVIDATFTGDEGATVNVRSGPCAPLITRFSPERWVLEEP